MVIFERLRNLFSVNVKLTFYDITSSYFYTDSCPLGANGYSQDNRSDLEQIVIGVVTSFEGYPIKHYVFEAKIAGLTNLDEVVYADFKPLLQGLEEPREKKLCCKIF